MAVEGYFFTPLVLLIIPKECHDEFFIKFNFFHGKAKLFDNMLGFSVDVSLLIFRFSCSCMFQTGIE